MNNYEINKQLGINKPIKHDLKSCLNDLTKDKIMGYMQSYGVKGVSKLKKAEIIDKFYDEFITNKKIEVAMKALGTKELELIDRLVVEKEVDITNADVNDFITLNIAGFAFIYAEKESLKLVMPDENIKIVKMLNNKEIHKEAKEADTLQSYLNSFVELYGAFKVDFFVKAFYEYTGEKFSEKDLVDLFKENDNEIGLAYFRDGYIMNQVVAAYENELENLIASRIDKEFKMLDKELLLKYGTQDFIEMTLAHENLLALILKVNKDEEIALDILFELQVRFITQEYDMYAALGIIDKVINLNKVKKNVINDMVKKTLAMYDNTRRWSNKGFTNVELKEMNIASVEAPKVGRNEPCPCGSGKKYKKCCISA